MTVYLKARGVHLEMPLDLQRVGENDAPSGFLATVGGTERRRVTLLSGINFEAHEGDRIGVLGLNGAGKTTLLRVLNGAFPPTRGLIERQGSVQSLLNSTLGFAEYATVTENVFLRGTAIGLRRRQLEAALPDILAFAGLEDRATHRLQTLSSGQRMRLGFAISTSIQPDILLMDEWIATGDAAFIKRAQDRLRGRFNDSRIVVLASHNTRLIRDMCNKVLVLHEGGLRFLGTVAEGMDVYRDLVANADAAARHDLALADPLLFSDVVGLIDQVRIGARSIELSGWAMSDKGDEVRVLCVDIDGNRRIVDKFERVDRHDVLLHIGKKSGCYGFRLELSADPGVDPSTLLGRMTICAGKSVRELGPPLVVIRAATVEYASEALAASIS